MGMVVHSWMRNGLINCGGRGARGSLYDPVLGICCHFCRPRKSSLSYPTDDDDVEEEADDQTIEKKEKKAVRVTEDITDRSSSENNEEEPHDPQLTESSEEPRKDMSAQVSISSEAAPRNQFGGSQSKEIHLKP
ncbi:hypothetical protein KSP40_PGU000881 [Platanthera guangdongensis]|uniref:Uncharacterized protein n=1 Tax=Platanthera guangdongensis TaxID=2320717 RepID=A0ABR2LDH3_9ASPA